MSGHSKWSTIKRKKGSADAKRSQMFSRIIKEMMVAVKDGGPDPETNTKLRLCINNAKGANMPKENIQRAITKADQEKTGIQELTFEGYGFSGVAIFIETLTDNNNRTVSFVRSIFTKKGGSLGTNGSLSFLFDRKGVFTIPAANVKSMDDFEMGAIEGGAEEIEVNDDTIEITVAMEDFGRMQKALEAMEIEVENAELRRIPNDLKPVDARTAMKVLRMIDDFEEIDDVVAVYHNMEMTDEIMAEIEAGE